MKTLLSVLGNKTQGFLLVQYHNYSYNRIHDIMSLCKTQGLRSVRMAIENETILNKMLKEINDAKENQNNQDKLLIHINNVKLLCDLFLEEDSEKNSAVQEQRDEFTEAELKAMIGKQDTIKKIQQQQLKQSETIDHEQANGDSIFDF